MTMHTHLEKRASRRPDGGTVVADLMTPYAFTCRPTDTLDRAARLMWEHDCGAIPIVDTHGHVVGIVTDRDLCMAAYSRGEPLWKIPVMVAGARRVRTVAPHASLARAQSLMMTHRVGRLPVIDVGGNLVGMLSLADIVRGAGDPSRRDDALCPANIVSMSVETFRGPY